MRIFDENGIELEISCVFDKFGIESNLSKVRSIKVVGKDFKAFVNWTPTNKTSICLEDDGKTLKIFEMDTV